MRNLFFGLIALVSPTLACTDVGSSDVDHTDVYGQASQWSPEDNPDQLLNRVLEKKAAALPNTGRVGGTGVWPGDYWATYNDSINYRWMNSATLSPAEKYQRAFAASGGAGFVGRVQAMHGIRSGTGATCNSDAVCGEGETCAIERGASKGKCTATWTGICHGWAPASFLVPEPKYPVTVNGVRFEVSDIKALASLLYTNVDANLISLRCEELLDGRTPASPECKDTNAGAFHVAITNLVGIGKKSFVLDRTIDAEVWNHPIVGYSVMANVGVDAATANQLVTGRRGAYERNPAAKAFRRITMNVDLVVESDARSNGPLQPQLRNYIATETYTYVLELNAQGAIIGGEWYGASTARHPDFLWAPKGRLPDFQADGRTPWTSPEGLRSNIVHGLVNDSQRANVVR